MRDLEEIDTLAWARALDWAHRYAEANPGVRATAEIGNWRLTYRVTPEGWPVVEIYQVATE